MNISRVGGVVRPPVFRSPQAGAAPQGSGGETPEHVRHDVGGPEQAAVRALRARRPGHAAQSAAVHWPRKFIVKVPQLIGHVSS